MQPIIEIRGVSFAYNSIEVLKDINLKINKGEFVGLIGPNGSGKTTLLKLILGILNQKEGEISLFNKKINDFKEWHKIGYVPQKATNIDSNFPATVSEIVSMGLLSVKNLPKIFTKEDNKKIKESLQIVNMQDYSKKRITELSGGQQQRVLIAKALVTNPEVLLLDEPTTGVDSQNQTAFYELLGNLNKKGITIILVSHDIGRITDHVTKIASINQTLTFYGTHKEFCLNDKNHKHIHEHRLCLDKNYEAK